MSANLRIVMANDHGGVEIARELKAYLEGKGHEVVWLGTETEDSCDYPDQAKLACREYLKGSYDFGILCCGTGIGISISANKIKGIRCALPQNCYAAEKAKEHNNANFIAFGGRIDYPESPVSMIQRFIDTEVSKESRHQNRVAKMMALEK
ncbi:MAG: RpiB/LacA/LacB family sugar-phosphate isomerase [Sphaerochaetaceae bacterium]|nr:RpiB/LacA/LacB family sugar-phosphate isomerase [Sphaerochaetaceae bacterium]